MKLKVALWLVVVLLAMSVPVLAGIEAAMTAYANGDYKTALAEFTAEAKAGNAMAQFQLGLMYASGKGTAPDYKEALRWYRMAAEQGHREAQYGLAAHMNYKTGRFTKSTGSVFGWISQFFPSKEDARKKYAVKRFDNERTSEKDKSSKKECKQ